MPATLLMKAGEPKLLERRKFEQTLVQEQISSARRLRGNVIWKTLEQTSEAITESPQGSPKPRNEGSRMRIVQVCTKPGGRRETLQLQNERMPMKISMKMRSLGDSREAEQCPWTQMQPQQL